MKLPPQTTCPRCKGHGQITDAHANGSMLRALREKAGVSQRQASIHMGIAQPYLSDMEMGKRNFPKARMEQFAKAIKALRK